MKKNIFLILFFSTLYSFSQEAPVYIKNSSDTVRIISSKSNSLYAGIDNYMELNKKFIPYKNLIVEVHRGMVMEDEGRYILMVGRPGNTRLNIFQYDNGDTILCYSRFFQVKAVPQPYISLDGQNFEKTEKISYNQICKKRFEVTVSEDFTDKEPWYQIKSITVGYSYGTIYISKTCDGAILSAEILNDLKKNALGKELAFVFTLKGAGDIFKRTDPVRLTLY